MSKRNIPDTPVEEQPIERKVPQTLPELRESLDNFGETVKAARSVFIGFDNVPKKRIHDFPIDMSKVSWAGSGACFYHIMMHEFLRGKEGVDISFAERKNIKPRIMKKLCDQNNFTYSYPKISWKNWQVYLDFCEFEEKVPHKIGPNLTRSIDSCFEDFEKARKAVLSASKKLGEMKLHPFTVGEPRISMAGSEYASTVTYRGITSYSSYAFRTGTDVLRLYNLRTSLLQELECLKTRSQDLFKKQ